MGELGSVYSAFILFLVYIGLYNETLHVSIQKMSSGWIEEAK